MSPVAQKGVHTAKPGEGAAGKVVSRSRPPAQRLAAGAIRPVAFSILPAAAIDEKTLGAIKPGRIPGRSHLVEAVQIADGEAGLNMQLPELGVLYLSGTDHIGFLGVKMDCFERTDQLGLGIAVQPKIKYAFAWGNELRADAEPDIQQRFGGGKIARVLQIGIENQRAFRRYS